MARDLAVLGYEIIIYDQDPSSAASSALQIPHFRLPESVIDEEVGYITGIGNIEFRHQKVDSMKKILAEGYDACSWARARRAAATSTCRAARKLPPTSISPRLAVVGLVWPHQQGRQARDRAGRRQHGDGLLPHRAAAGRRGRQGDRPLGLRRDEGGLLGEGRRDGRWTPILNMQVPKEVTHKDGKITGVLSRR